MPNYHFTPKRPTENLVLSENHKLLGHVAKYLTNFQLEGIRFLYNHFKNNQSCILNDESGLGKTAMVCAFLDAVLPHDSSRKCLIIVRNDERIRNWKFHLDVLTSLSTKIVFKKEDIGKEILYLTKWDSFLKSNSLADYDFDCIIIDNRGELMANKICSGYLLRNYENRISLIVSSSDVAVDLKQFHTMLRLCSRLDKRYENFKIFEDKFSLPEDMNMLESYFLRREKIINFCRDFRLRRYRHQYEDEIPLVQPDIYMKSLKVWAENPISNSSSSSSSIRILTSSSEKDAEQLLKSFFNAKEETDLNKEVSQITAEAERKSRLQNNCYDYEEMSPLLFESDSDDKGFDRKENTKKIVAKHIIPIFVESDKRRRGRPVKKVPAEKHIEAAVRRNTRNTSKLLEAKSATAEKKSSNKLQGNKVKNKKVNISTPARNLRSHLATRSKTLKSKYLVIDLTDEDGQLRKVQKRRTKAIGPKRNIKNEKKLEKDESQNRDLNTNLRSTRSNVKKVNFKASMNSDCVNGREKLFKRKLENKSKSDRNESKIKKGCESLLTKGPEAKSNKNAAAEEKKHTKASKGKPSELENTSRNKRQSVPERNNSADVRFVSPQDQIIVLSSSTDECTPSLSGDITRVRPSKQIITSPDIFSNVVEECDITCSQKSKLSDSLKALGLLPKIGIRRNHNPSCLDLLEREFQKEKRGAVRDVEELFEISTSETLKTVRINDESSEVGPLKNRSVTYQKNKITKYLIGTDASSLSLESNQPIEILDTQKNYDSYPKTPARQKITQRRATTSKKSPKVANGRDMTPNSLTKWLIKSDSASTTVSRPSKRRRLDLWFND